MNLNPETAMQLPLVRRWLAGLAVVACTVLGGCDDVQVGGVGASVGLPGAYTDSATDTADMGAGNVHWVGNPRW